MKIRIAGIIILAILLMAAIGVVSAQTSPFIPAIILFESDLESVALTDLEAGDVTANVSWYIVNVGQGQSLALDYWRQNGWVSVLEEDETLLPIGEREVTLLDPLSFAPPTFRLTLLSGNTILDQRFLVIPYAEPAGEPTITSFETTATNVEAATLTQRNARVEVSWEVTDRIPFTTLVFEQVLSEDQTVNVELPRSTLYVASEGAGAVAPVTPVLEASIRLRLSVVNVLDGTIYDSEELVIPVSGNLNLPTLTPTPLSAPTFTPGGAVPTPRSTAPEATEEAVDEGPTFVEGGPQITIFTASPAVIEPGGSVDLTWSVTD